MINIDVLGYIAGILVVISLLHQVIKSWRTKSTKDISILWTLVVMIGLSLWILYATSNRIMPLLIFAAVEFIMIAFLFSLKIKYK